MLNRNTDSGKPNCDLLVVSNSCVVSARAPEKQKADSVNEFLLVDNGKKMRDVAESPCCDNYLYTLLLCYTVYYYVYNDRNVRITRIYLHFYSSK